MTKTRFHVSLFFVVVAYCSLFAASGCGGLNAAVRGAETPAAKEAEDSASYQKFSLPGEEGITFELPAGWSFWGNAGYLSPDGGKTLAGVRRSWMKEGRDAETALYNEGSTVHEKTTVMVGDREIHRYIVETTLKSASTGEVIWHAYEMIYAFPAPDGETMAGVVVSSPNREELAAWEEIAEHMVSSMRWAND